MKKILSLLVCGLLVLQGLGQEFIKDKLWYKITSNSEPYTVEVASHYYNQYLILAYYSADNDKLAYYNKMNDVIIYMEKEAGTQPKTKEIGGITYYLIEPSDIPSDYYFDGIDCVVILGDVVIPDTVENDGIKYTVTGIGDNVFSLRNLSSISIPSTVTYIGENAFDNSYGLSYIDVPNSIASIGENAFDGINEVTYGGNATGSPWGANKVTNFKKVCFQYDDFWYETTSDSTVELLYDITIDRTGHFNYEGSYGKKGIPEEVEYNSKKYTVTSIGENALKNYYTSDFTIPNTVTSIGANAFYGCTGLTGALIIPETVTNIGESAFYGIKDVTYGGNATGSPWGAQLICVAKDENFIYLDITKKQIAKYIGHDNEVFVPDSITSIESNAFEGIEIVEYFGNAAGSPWGAKYAYRAKDDKFYYFDKEKIQIAKYIGKESAVAVPDSVVSIDGNAFAGVDLTSIVLGDSLQYIGYGIFDGNSKLKGIVCNSLVPPIVEGKCFISNELENAKLYVNVKLTVPNGAEKLYSKMSPWSNFDFASDTSARICDTIYSIVHDSTYSVIHDTTFVYSKDTIQSIVYDTVYYIPQDVKAYNITVSSASTKMGIGIGNGMYAENSQVEIVAIANYGYHFTKWSDGKTSNPRIEKVTADSTFTAEFEVNNYNILATANEEEMGSVDGSSKYAYLSRTQLKAIPNAGYEFKEWSDGETANPREILVYSDSSFTAVFMVSGSTAIDGEVAVEVNIYSHNNIIVIENANADIEVFDTMGRLVARRGVACNGSEEIAMQREGLYIVKCGAEAKRVVVSQN